MDSHTPDQPSPPKRQVLRRVLNELGLVTLYRSPRDIKLLALQRAVRCFAYGFSTLVLVSYLKDLGIPEDSIGLFMTLTLVGDVCISLFLTTVADGLGRKTVLALGSAMMAASGIVFAMSGNYWILLAAAVFGVISPSGHEIGPFRAVEESTIAWLTPKEERSDIYAWYSLAGTLGLAFGIISCGWIVDALLLRKDWDTVRAYRAMFFLYAIMGLVKMCLALVLSSKCEVEKSPPEPQTAQPEETDPLLSDAPTPPPKNVKRISILPSIAKESVPTVVKLALLFSVDSFASGLVSMSWVVYFIKTKFDVPSGTLGTIFFSTSVVAAASMLVASSIAKRFGNIKTMVFTHLPSAIFLAFIPLPSELPLALTLMILRACSHSMDTAPRSAFLAAVLRPAERTAIMGFFTILKTASGAVAPSITGLLASNHLFWVAFVAAGSLKASYDIGLLLVFATKEKESQEQDHREDIEHSQ